MENPKNIDFWEKFLQDLPASYAEWLNHEPTYLLENIEEGSSVLEVGCGNGRSLKVLLKRTKNITGIDHDQTAVDHAKENMPEAKFEKADAVDLPFDDNSFDYVLCLTSFANFGDKKFKALEEMKRVLKNDGFILFSVFAENALPERMKAYKKFNLKIKEVSDKGKVLFDELTDANVSEQFSKQDLENIFKQVNLYPIEIFRVGIGYFAKLSKKAI
tara:strand:+ start:1055 stop:1702 length:648 start_codon:yes stop_codon:yes gene_type:complete